MRGRRPSQPPMFFAINVEDRIRADHPLRGIKKMVDEELRLMSPLFAQAYSDTGRPSVPPETLLKALLLQCLYSIRSERQLAERIDTDLLFRWFLDMDPAQDAFDATTITHNRPRLEKFGLVAAFFSGVVRRAVDGGLTSDEHFCVDGTLIESHASIKSFKPIDQNDDNDTNGYKSRNAEVNFHGQKRSNQSHISRTDPEARLYRKGDGQPARLSHMGHALAENRHGLVLAVQVTAAEGTAEVSAALAMIDRLGEDHRIRPGTLAADKGYDGGPFLLELEARGIEPHVAVKDGRIGGKKQTSRLHRKNRPLIAARRRMKRRMRTASYRLSQRTRKKIEEAFSWIKDVGGLARTKLVGRWKIAQQMELNAAAYNLVRMRKLMA